MAYILLFFKSLGIFNYKPLENMKSSVFSKVKETSLLESREESEA